MVPVNAVSGSDRYYLFLVVCLFIQITLQQQAEKLIASVSNVLFSSAMLLNTNGFQMLNHVVELQSGSGEE